MAVLVSACDFWPKDLKPLAESISEQVSGETTAWLLGGDSIVVNVANSPRYRATQSDLEALATEIAGQAIEFSQAPLEAIAITFFEGAVSDDPEKMREFIFVVLENRPILQPDLDVNATGPLTLDEVQAAVERLGESVTDEQRECVLGEMEKRADIAGDPETIDPSSEEFLSAVSTDTWNNLDSFGKRIILTQVITTKALFFCVSTK